MMSFEKGKERGNWPMKESLGEVATTLIWGT